MSWSVTAVGRPLAVAAEIEKQFFHQGKCREPEESIRQLARKVITASLAAQRLDSAVRVAATGSLNLSQHQGQEQFQNSFEIKIEPIYGFLEQ